MWRGQIVVPITDKAGRLMNVQLINSQGRKLFWKGAPCSKAGATSSTGRTPR
jgi:phage/plasmid primase-like uncharacterized protein